MVPLPALGHTARNFCPIQRSVTSVLRRSWPKTAPPPPRSLKHSACGQQRVQLLLLLLLSTQQRLKAMLLLRPLESVRAKLDVQKRPRFP
jgi:hypothetical protein